MIFIVLAYLLVVGVLLVGGSLTSTYFSQKTSLGAQRNASVLACRAGLKSTYDNAEFAYAGYLARRLSAETVKGAERQQNFVLAAEFRKIASDLNSRTAPWHSVVWPIGSGKHPLGLGTRDCEKVFPTPHVPFFG